MSAGLFKEAELTCLLLSAEGRRGGCMSDSILDRGGQVVFKMEDLSEMSTHLESKCVVMLFHITAANCSVTL